MPAPWILIPSLLLLASLVALLFGLRGRRIDDHPLCRRCGFDLTGKPATSSACPECGMDLRRARAIRIGHRARRGKLLFGGVTGTVLGIGLIGGAIYLSANPVDLNAHKPYWLLRREALGGGSSESGAVGELLRRLRAGQLSGPQVRQLVDDAMARQADAARKWISGWGQIVEGAKDRGLVADDLWLRYLVQGTHPAVVLAARAAVRRGDPLPAMVRIDEPRIGSARVTLNVPLSVELGGVRALPNPYPLSSCQPGYGRARSASAESRPSPCCCSSSTNRSSPPSPTAPRRCAGAPACR